MSVKIKTVVAMRKYGGSFVKALAEAMIAADQDNQARIEAAFPEIFSKYGELAEQATEAA